MYINQENPTWSHLLPTCTLRLLNCTCPALSESFTLILLLIWMVQCGHMLATIGTRYQMLKKN